MQVLKKVQIFTVPLKKMGNMSAASSRIQPVQISFNFLLAVESASASLQMLSSVLLHPGITRGNEQQLEWSYNGSTWRVNSYWKLPW